MRSAFLAPDGAESPAAAWTRDEGSVSLNP